VEATDFLSSDELPAAGERLAIAFEGSELVRGGGGPRCMTMPIRRDELE
jgi:arginine deiminase